MNAKQELLEELEEMSLTVNDIEIISIKINYDISGNEYKIIKQIDDINLRELDFNYDNGYGTQYLYGYILFKNGRWLERQEYDGSEWWQSYRPLTRKMLIGTLEEKDE